MKNIFLVAILAICLNSVRSQSVVVCPAEGTHVLPHPTYCAKYVLCVQGTPWELRCADGLHWSEEWNHCTHPDLAECKTEIICPDFDDVNFPVIIPDEDDCEKYNVCCSGEKVSLQCGPDFHFNPITFHCDTKENANCELDPEIDITITCPSAGIHFLPHPRDCHYYFICVYGEESSIQSCATDLYWDSLNNRCDVRDNVLCADDVSCPDDGISFIPHPKSCSAYFMCINNIPNQLTCAPGSYFNPIQNYCDLTTNVVCNFQCPSEGLYFLPHEHSCQHFFLCANGTPQLQSCADGLLFDSVNNQCDVPDNSVCYNTDV